MSEEEFEREFFTWKNNVIDIFPLSFLFLFYLLFLKIKERYVK